ncbi:MAG TPA: PepSY domain-containing protein [Candidatus Udaeobacter sp.]|nr:PepSY domain-containing protein [Candidatus Udaeobacter sp.]
MEIKSLLLTAVIGAGLACGVAAQAREQPGEMVQVKSLPASVQQTISQKAAGGEIVRVKREDDANGRWNYEVVVRSQGKEWGFEVDPNGKLLRTHGEKK